MTDFLSTVNSTHAASTVAPTTCIGLAVIAHPDVRRVGERAVLFDLDGVGARAVSRLVPVFRGAAGSETDALKTPRVSRAELTLTRDASRAISVAWRGKPSAVEVDGQPLTGARVLDAATLRSGVTIVMGEEVGLFLGEMDVRPDASVVPGIVGTSPAIARVRREVVDLSGTEGPVLLVGEDGAGKELVARAIHSASTRRERPFLSIDASMLVAPEAAATGTRRRRPVASGDAAPLDAIVSSGDVGTLFVDGIGDLPARMRRTLLRAVDPESSVAPAEWGFAGARLIAAVTSDLEKEVDDPSFRAALAQRFVREVRVPPLRARREDVGVLFAHFLVTAADAQGARARLVPDAVDGAAWVPARFVASLVRQDWPGNVRQLRNVAERLVSENHDAGRAVISRAIERAMQGTAPPNGATAGEVETRRAGEMPAIDDVRRAMRASGYNISRAARELGVSTSWLHPYLKRTGLAVRALDLGREVIVDALERHGGDPAAAANELGVSVHGLRLRMAALQLTP